MMWEPWSTYCLITLFNGLRPATGESVFDLIFGVHPWEYVSLEKSFGEGGQSLFVKKKGDILPSWTHERLPRHSGPS